MTCNRLVHEQEVRIIAEKAAIARIGAAGLTALDAALGTPPATPPAAAPVHGLPGEITPPAPCTGMPAARTVNTGRLRGIAGRIAGYLAGLHAGGDGYAL